MDRIFDSRPKANTTATKQHEIETILFEIDSIARKNVQWRPSGLLITGGGDKGVWVTDVSQKISRLIELDPENADYKLAEVSVYLAALHFRTAEERLRTMLTQHPHHLEGQLMLKFLEKRKWCHLFTLPSWEDNAYRIPEQFQLIVAQRNNWDCVRIGVKRILCIFLSSAHSSSLKPITDKTDCKIKAVFSDTPYGPVVAIYVIIEDDSAKPLIVETFLDPVPDPYAPDPWNNGDFLIQHLAQQDFTYIVASVQGNVKLNRKLIFDHQTKFNLRTVTEKVRDLQELKPNSQSFIRAAQWHMQNFSLDKIQL